MDQLFEPSARPDLALMGDSTVLERSRTDNIYMPQDKLAEKV